MQEKKEVTAGARTLEIGMTIKVYNQTCRIVKVHPFGTVDVVTLDGERAYRVTGLPFTKEAK